MSALPNVYSVRRDLTDGRWLGVYQMLFTVALCVGDATDRDWHKRRYCYETLQHALKAFFEWDGEGDPPGPWIKEKPGDRLGPGAIK